MATKRAPLRPQGCQHLKNVVLLILSKFKFLRSHNKIHIKDVREEETGDRTNQPQNL